MSIAKKVFLSQCRDFIMINECTNDSDNLLKSFDLVKKQENLFIRKNFRTRTVEMQLENTNFMVFEVTRKDELLNALSQPHFPSNYPNFPQNCAKPTNIDSKKFKNKIVSKYFYLIENKKEED